MQQYQPYVRITSESCGTSQLYTFEETKFIAVTAYQNSQVSILDQYYKKLCCPSDNFTTSILCMCQLILYLKLNCIFVLFNRSHSSRLTTTLMLELSVRLLLLLMAVEQRKKVVTTLSASAVHQSPEDPN